MTNLQVMDVSMKRRGWVLKWIQIFNTHKKYISLHVRKAKRKVITLDDAINRKCVKQMENDRRFLANFFKIFATPRNDVQ